jgi:hypothetical protein
MIKRRKFNEQNAHTHKKLNEFVTKNTQAHFSNFNNEIMRIGVWCEKEMAY